MSDQDDLDIKKRARRRLVGAAALALAAAIVLPMMMEQEPRPLDQDIQVAIPERDADSALARPIAGPGPDAEIAAVDPELGAATPEAPPTAEALSEPEAPPPKPEPPPAPQPEPKPQPAAKPAPKPEPKPAPKPTPPKPAPKSAEEAEAERVRAILRGESPPPVAAAAPQSASFLVQVGAFGDAGRAASVAAELKKAGIGAYTEKAGGVTRVRVGPFSNRAAADREAGRVRALGHAPVVVRR